MHSGQPEIMSLMNAINVVKLAASRQSNRSLWRVSNSASVIDDGFRFANLGSDLMLQEVVQDIQQKGASAARKFSFRS
jgi:hypothetical protein